MKKIFFSASTYAVPELIDNYLQIISAIEKNNAKVSLNWTKDWKDIAKKYKKEGKKEIEESDVLNIINRKKFFEEHLDAIIDCDALIAEVTKPTISVGYQIYFAIYNKKPILALYTDLENTNLRTIKSIVSINSPLVLFKKYNRKSLPQIIKNFIIKRNVNLKKFNFLISNEIEEYINWLKKQNPQMSRSELLRDKISNEIIIRDNKYQNFFKKI